MSGPVSRRPSAPCSLTVRDCSTCSRSVAFDEDGQTWLACEAAGDPESEIQEWRDCQALLNARGWPVGPHLSPCPGWSPAWGEETP